MATARSALFTRRPPRISQYLCPRAFSTTAANALIGPSIAPKSSIDVKGIRQNPELHSQNCLDRNYKAQSQNPPQIVKLFEEWKGWQHEGRSLRERNNILRTKLSHQKTFSGLEASNELAPKDKEGILEEARQLKEQIGRIEIKEAELLQQIEELAYELPNLTSKETPVGTEPRVIGYINKHPEPSVSPVDPWRNHVHIGNELDLLDFSAAGVTSGWGWYFLKNEAALLEQALVQYSIGVAVKNGFSVVSPPSIVYSHISGACGFRPRDQGGEQQVYAIQQTRVEGDKTGKPELCLTGTAEIPFASMKANVTMEEADLPLNIVGSSRSYRAEAGGRGEDTKGLYRVHEFTKVEMFGWTLPDGSEVALFDKMLGVQVKILQSLGLHCRILEQPSTDLGASATRKKDIEAYFPSRLARNSGWGEVTSTSICTDYQTRRLATRVRSTRERTVTYPYTVNGTAMAVPRVLAAILEHHWDSEESCVRIPEVLWPWMHGIEVIRKKH